jgi:glycine oxidase
MIVVVGAGLIGLAIAHELAARGASVRVMDAREPARAASWAGAGMLAPYAEAIESPAYAAFCRLSLAMYPGFVRNLVERGGVDPHLRLHGILEATFDPAQAERLRARVGERAAAGVAVRWLDRDEARRLEPALDPRVLGASLCDAEGCVDNRRLGRALRAACAARGVRIDAFAGEIAIEADTRRVLGIRGPDGFVAATHVVNAAGAWAGRLAGVPTAAVVPVGPIKGQMLALTMTTRVLPRTVWVPGAYLVPRDDGRLLVGASVEDAGFDVRVTAGGIGDLLAAAVRAMPHLADEAIVETWAGLRPGTPDGLPILGESATAGYFVASGHYRNGILLTPASAVAIADAIEGVSTAALEPFSPRRFAADGDASGKKSESAPAQKHAS